MRMRFRAMCVVTRPGGETTDTTGVLRFFLVRQGVFLLLIFFIFVSSLPAHHRLCLCRILIWVDRCIFFKVAPMFPINGFNDSITSTNSRFLSWKAINCARVKFDFFERAVHESTWKVLPAQTTNQDCPLRKSVANPYNCNRAFGQVVALREVPCHGLLYWGITTTAAKTSGVVYFGPETCTPKQLNA